MRPAVCLFMCVVIASCQLSPGRKGNCPRPEGRYMNATLLAACDSVLYATKPFFALELRFVDSTRVMADNGFEQFPLEVVYEPGNCRGVLKGATQLGDMRFSIPEDGLLELEDTGWTDLPANTTFRQAPTEERKSWSFRQHLSACVFRHTYVRHVDGKPQAGRIEALPNGQLSGMRPYLGYTLCYSGDCLEEVQPFMPNITFINDSGELHTYGLQILDNGYHLQFFHLAPPVPDVKGERQVGALAFEWIAE